MDIKRWIRGVKFLLTALFVEYPQGLDFSMRQKKHGISTRGNHGYALTQKEAFRNIMKNFKVTADDAFIDIGCGKGGVLRYAAECGFGRVAGLEIEKSLYQIAKKNFAILKMTSIELFNDNAVTFGKYNEFNYFFLFNPFDEDIYIKVIDNIVNSTSDSDKEVYLLCYGASIPEYIMSTNHFSMIKRYTDEVRGTAVCLWKRIK